MIPVSVLGIIVPPSRDRDRSGPYVSLILIGPDLRDRDRVSAQLSAAATSTPTPSLLLPHSQSADLSRRVGGHASSMTIYNRYLVPSFREYSVDSPMSRGVAPGEEEISRSKNEPNPPIGTPPLSFNLPSRCFPTTGYSSFLQDAMQHPYSTVERTRSLFSLFNNHYHIAQPR